VTIQVENIEPNKAQDELHKGHHGQLFSGGKVLVTDSAGQTRDRITTSRTARITLNAGGTVYRFQVPVGPPPEP